MTHIFPSKHILTSASVVSVASISSVPSSLAHSVGDTPLYAPTLVQDLSAADLPSQSDIIIVYVHIQSLYPELKILQCHGPDRSG